MKRIPKIPSYEKKTGKPLRPPIKALYDAMYESRLTFAEVEKLSGVSDTAIGGWFYQNKQPKIDVYCAVAEALGFEMTLRKEQE